MAKQRGHGEGSIYKRVDGRWEAALTLPDGKRRRLYARTRAEAAQKLATALQDLKRGALLTGPSQTVAQYLGGWLSDVARPSVRPRTFEAYDLCVRRVLPHLGKLKLAALTPAHVQRCYGALLDGGLSRRSVEQVHAVLHRALHQAVLWDVLGRNPCDGVSAPRPQRREMQTLTEDQVKQLLAVDDCFYALWALLVSTGLRLGEATGLVWGDIDLRSGRLTVQRALQRQRGAGLVLVEPKTERSRRTVYLADGVVAALIRHRIRQGEERLAAGPLWQDQGFVFCNSFGGPLDPARVNESFHRVLQAAGLPRVRVHDLRHTAATLLLERGVHPKIVQELLGHSTIMLTLDTYSHVSPSLHAGVATHMNALFEGAASAF